MNILGAPPGQPDAPPAVGEMLARALGRAGIGARRSGDTLLLPSGLRLQAAAPETQALESGVVTATRIVAFHDVSFPQGLPEVVRAAGQDAAQAMAEGFARWVKTTLVVLEDALRPGVRDCALLALRLPAQGDAAPRAYQAVLGPILRWGTGPGRNTDDEPCPACMTTRIQDALCDRLRVDGPTGIALLAGRDEHGALAADCQIDGEVFPAGVERLIAYAGSWPARGFEFRLQYVIIRPVPQGARASSGQVMKGGDS